MTKSISVAGRWLCMAALLLPLTAFGHAILKQSAPANGSVLTAAPARIVLVFSEPAHLTSISIRRQDGRDAGPIGPPPGAAARQFALTIPSLAAGTYTIHYRVLSADDGHITAGQISFTLSPRSGKGVVGEAP